MQHIRFFILGILILSAFCTKAQDVYMATVRGKITSVESGEPIPYAHIINPRVHGGTTSNADGIFTIKMLTEDTLIVRSVGFVDEKFFVEEFPPKELYEIKLKPVRFLLDEVDVKGENQMRKKLGLPEAKELDIPTELRGTAFNEKPNVLAALVTPLSFLQYHTSKDEKEKRAIRQMIQDEKEWTEFSKYHNLDNVKRLTGLQGKEADKFMVYCNYNNALPYYASQMQIEFQIMYLFNKYKEEQKDSSSK